MPEKPRNERRKHPRSDVSIEVNYHILGLIDNLSYAQTKNSSLAGFLLRTETEFKRGVCLVLEIPWPSRLTPIRLLGRVVESCLSNNPITFDTRIEFLAMNDDTRRVVENLIEHYLEQSRGR
ncbi:MAG TPA: PilZ domain-containing protein [Candidatus Omnitrophota bacterium]|nr:PilZ domain-containing protein [Candidatus Omnitrophota bacterium]